MPKKVHRRLVKQAKKLNLTGKRFDAYVYGALDKLKNRQKYRKRVVTKIAKP